MQTQPGMLCCKPDAGTRLTACVGVSLFAVRPLVQVCSLPSCCRCKMEVTEGTS